MLGVLEATAINCRAQFHDTHCLLTLTPARPQALRVCPASILNTSQRSQARPQASDVLPDGNIAPRPVALPCDVSGAEHDVQDATAAEVLDWTDVWQHALADTDAALVARVALDDSNAAVSPL